jgi:hypothetical protein
MTSQSNNLGTLFAGATQDGILSKAALNAINIGDIGADINNALGVSVDDVPHSEVVIVTQLIDDSGSIRFVTGNTEAVRDGHNLILDSLTKTKQGQAGSILASCSYLNGTLLYPYTTVDKAARMSSSNYDPTGGTPLFAQSVVTLGTVMAKWLEFRDNGITCRTVTPIITDGGDNNGLRGADKVKKIVDDMLKQECHIIAGVGIDDGTTDYHAVFGAMGIRKEWILTPKNSPSEIRRAFQMLSQSATRASQSAATFSQAAMGGFGAP